MRNFILIGAFLALAPLATAEEATEEATPEVAFHEPIQVMADGAAIAVESPGFACPTFVDVDGDGLRDLVVGQFRDGKMTFFKNTGSASEPTFAAGTWIMSGDKPAVVPGVW